MAKLKSSARAKRAPASSKPKASAPGSQSRAEQMQRSIVDSAQQIWLAGVGAFSRAQDEGTKMFETLVKEGVSIEKTTRKFAGDRADKVRGVVEESVGQARGRATDTWDRLEKVFEQRVQHALNRLGVPGRDELQSLTDQVEALNAELRRVNAGGKPKKSSARKAAGKKAGARKSAAKKPAAKKAAAKKPAAKKPAARKPAARKKAAAPKAVKAPKPSTARTTKQTAAKKSAGRAKAIPTVASPQAPGSASGSSN